MLYQGSARPRFEGRIMRGKNERGADTSPVRCLCVCRNTGNTEAYPSPCADKNLPHVLCVRNMSFYILSCCVYPITGILPCQYPFYIFFPFASCKPKPGLCKMHKPGFDLLSAFLFMLLFESGSPNRHCTPRPAARQAVHADLH